MMTKSKIEKEGILTNYTISGRKIRRVVYHGNELTKLRHRTGLNQTQFGAMCGWNQQHQSRLELPMEQEIDFEKLNLINNKAEEILKRQA